MTFRIGKPFRLRAALVNEMSGKQAGPEEVELLETQLSGAMFEVPTGLFPQGQPVGLRLVSVGLDPEVEAKFQAKVVRQSFDKGVEGRGGRDTVELRFSRWDEKVWNRFRTLLEQTQSAVTGAFEAMKGEREPK